MDDRIGQAAVIGSDSGDDDLHKEGAGQREIVAGFARIQDLTGKLPNSGEFSDSSLQFNAQLILPILSDD